MSTLTYTDTLQIIECGSCHIPFAIPDNLYKARRKDGKNFYCPNGHYIGYSNNENTRLKARLDQAEAEAAWQRGARDRARADADHQAARVRGYQGALAKTKKRAAHGVCPCCSRTFADVARHVAGQHPDYVRAHG